jgi:CelD/BcsL family acetyltransferase involved in cellulose biosynthesis
VKVTVVQPDELGKAELETWREFQRTQPDLGSPFLSPEFAVAVARIRPGTRVGVLEDGDDVVGFFAFERRRLGYGLPVAPGLNECQGVVHAPGLEWDARELIRGCGLVLWEYDNLMDGQRPFESFARFRQPSPVMDLGGGFDAYLAGRRRSSSRIRDLPRRRRRLEREVGPVRFVFDAQDPQALETLMRWKSAQYRRTGRADRVAWPWVVELLQLMLESRADGCAGRLSLLYAGEELVAGHFGLSSERVIPTWFPAYDPRFARHSPGLLLHVGMAEAAAAAGITTIDMGRGAKDYKEEHKSRDIVVAEGRVTRPSPAAAVHWLRRAPIRRLRHEVIENPSLLRAADRVLRGYARVRNSTGRTPVTPALTERGA